ncbi:hypothetical protein DPMN_045084 [Dreissena polymorpha]|uniref:Uncharacterized protein n=1 Tax=Dreissena polymorpha TaxID=45954 RepID=A0A9D4D4E1_DREPO|nr:hypothetical protein DPMN_045084 [Dreissena polymorpha]
MVGRLRLYQRIIVVRRLPGLIESDDRQSTACCSTYCRATAVHPLHHDCSSLDALSAPKTRAKRLTDNIRRYQDHLDTCRTIPDSLRRFQMVYHTSWTPAESLRRCQYHLGTCRRHPDILRRCQKDVRTGEAPAGDSQTVYDGAKTVCASAGESRLCQTVSQTSVAPARDSQTVGDDAKTVLVPARDSQTVPDGLPDRRGTGRRLPVSP